MEVRFFVVTDEQGHHVIPENAKTTSYTEHAFDSRAAFRVYNKNVFLEAQGNLLAPGNRLFPPNKYQCICFAPNKGYCLN